jgi:hypothetical protein
VEYQSVRWHESKEFAGVRFAIRKVSLAARIELTRQARELTLRYEFLKAGDQQEQLEAALSDLLVRQLYLSWALKSIEGLTIDGEPATTQTLIEQGPERLSGEIAEAIVRGIELSEEERKNF